MPWFLTLIVWFPAQSYPDLQFVAEPHPTLDACIESGENWEERFGLYVEQNGKKVPIERVVGHFCSQKGGPAPVQEGLRI